MVVLLDGEERDMHYDLVIFDCDGTLVDSLWAISRVMNLALAEHGLPHPLSNAEVGTVVGLSLHNAMAQLLPDSPAALHEALVASYKAHYLRLADGGELAAPLFPGARETMDALRGAGVELAMATGKSMRGVERNLREFDLGGYFRVLKSADCAPSKPDPGMVTQILAETGHDPHRTLMVGDTDFDLYMGRAAGVRTCAVTFGCHPRPRLAAARPDHWVERLPDLLAVVGVAGRAG